MLKRLEGTGHRLAPDAADPAAQAASCAAPTCATTARSLVVDGRVGFTGLAEPHRARLQQAEEPQARPQVGRADGAGRGPGRRTTWTRSSRRTGTPRPTRLPPSWLAGRDRRRATPRRASGVACPGRARAGPGFVAENNLRLFTTLIYSRAAPDLADQPVLRPGRVAALRRHDRGAARRRRRAVRQRGVRPVHGRARPGVVLPRRCSRPACGSTSTRRPTSCTPSTSRSTTTSR